MIYLVVFSLLGLVSAHRSLPAGVTCSNQFSTREDALNIPDPSISWAAYRIQTCDAPVLWMKGDFTAGQSMEFTLGLPVLERFGDVRSSVAIMGPGLPPVSELSDDETARVPQSVLDSVQEGEGMILVESVDDQSTCDHIGSEVMQRYTEVKDDRCHFYEEFGGSENWVLIDDQQFAAEAGEYHFAIFSKNQKSSKLWFACCAWPEDFVTPHDIPEPTCPYCGTQPKLNTAWSSHFYEHKSMAQYGGFPPAESCVDNENPPTPPAEAQCPPERSQDDPVEEQPESCRLGCSKGECHSHNVFGQCRYDIDWTGSAAKLGDFEVSNMILFKGDTLTFSSENDVEMPYSLYRIANSEKYEACDFEGAEAVALTEDLGLGVEYTFEEAGEYYLVSTIMDQCEQGLKLAVEIKDASEGRHCHSHEKDFLNAVQLEKPKCKEGFELVHVLDDKRVGAKKGLCSEFCAFSFALTFMKNVKEGPCSDSGYTEFVKDLTFHLKGLDWKFGAVIYSRAKEESSEDDEKKGKWDEIKDKWGQGKDGKWGEKDGKWGERRDGKWGKKDDGRRRLVDALTCPGNQVVANVVEDADYGLTSGQCGEFCTPGFAINFIPTASRGSCSAEYSEVIAESKTVKPEGSPMEVTIRVLGKAADDENEGDDEDAQENTGSPTSTPAPEPVTESTQSPSASPENETTPSPTAAENDDSDMLECEEGNAAVHLIASPVYGADEGEDQCSEFCVPEIAKQFTGAIDGPCSDELYPALVRITDVQPQNSPVPFTVYVMGKEAPPAPELDTTQCHCHSYEEIKCDESGQDLYDEHIEEIEANCQGVVSGEDESCPYLCFQPFEILHINYRECNTRPEHPLYQAIAKTNKCHQAALAPSEDECDWEESESKESESSDDESEEPKNDMIDSLEALQELASKQVGVEDCNTYLGKWKKKKSKCTPPTAKKVSCKKFNDAMCGKVTGCSLVSRGKKTRCTGDVFQA